MLKEMSEAEDEDENEKILTLSHSVNAAIAEAIADEIAQDRGGDGERCGGDRGGENTTSRCDGLVETLGGQPGSHGLVHDLEEHHYVSHNEPIIFQIEPPPNHECVLTESLTDMRNAVCEEISDRRIEMTDCGAENGSMNVLIEKYTSELVDSNLNGVSYKAESMMITESSDEDECHFQEAKSLEENNPNENLEEKSMMHDTNLTEPVCKERFESKDKGKPPGSKTQRFKCPNCIKTFGTKTSLDRHTEIHNKKMHHRYACTMCDKEFENVAKLENHLVTNHENRHCRSRHGCVEKIREYNAGQEMMEKENDDDDDNDDEKARTEKRIGTPDAKKSTKFGCNICGKQFTYQKSFLTHAKTHPGYEPETIFEKDENHVWEDSNERGRESEDDDLPLEGLQCTQCGKLFATKRNLKRHISTHSGLKFHCSACNKEFSRIDKLKEHEQSKHKEEFFASSDSDSDNDITDNENKHDDGSENSRNKKEKHNRPHRCPMCPKAFAQEQSLRNHMERHERVKDTQKRFLCEVCSKCFAQSGSLVAHMRTHTGIKPYVCNVCSRAFTKSTYLQLHLRTHSGEKPYICQYCSRAFARANTLARHITMHTGEAKYHCQICMKSFRRLTSLNEHTYTHTGQRPYACKICTKRYNNAGSLYAHTKKCKAQQQSSGTTNLVLPLGEEHHQNDAQSETMIYSQRKSSEPLSVEQIQPTPQFIISNVHNPSLKTLPNNIMPQFAVQDPNFCNLNNSKSFKNTSYYTIYPNI
ncbi:zinc finger protein 12-like isoform X2 [Venturia canescens]|nr:zinc finger protein 12-like isoform X2 [Venturia canescens]